MTGFTLALPSLAVTVTVTVPESITLAGSVGARVRVLAPEPKCGQTMLEPTGVVAVYVNASPSGSLK